MYFKIHAETPRASRGAARDERAGLAGDVGGEVEAPANAHDAARVAADGLEAVALAEVLVPWSPPAVRPR